MKKIFSLLLILIIITSTVIAQQVPQGMKYQAVARNLKGDILANEQIVLKITLSSKRGGSSVAYYTEMHNVKTNELGLFTLVIGEGASTKSNFNEIPWSSENIWMDIDIADKSKGGFTTISSSKLLAVPYAFHAATANKLTSMPEEIVTGSSTGSSTPPSNPWTVKGNSGVSVGDYLGTSDSKSISIRTNGLERMLLTNTGDLSVLNNVSLNTASGNTINNGNFTVANSKATSLTGTLDVMNNVAVNTNKFNINASTGNTSLAGTLGIVGNLSVNTNKFNIAALTGNTSIAGTLNVANPVSFTDGTQSTSTANGAFIVAGGEGIGKNLNIGGDLNVAGVSTLANLKVDGVNGKSINISDNTTGYLATFENTNNNSGDGIKIILGRRHPLYPSLGASAFTLPNLSQNPFANTTTAFQNYFNTLINTKGSFSADDLLTDAGNGLLSDLGNVAQVLASKLTDITNIVINKVNEGLGKVNTALSLPYNLATPINNGLGLPFNISAPINSTLGLPKNFSTPINNALHLPFNIATPINDALGLPIDYGIGTIPAIGGTALTIPAIPSLTLPAVPSLTVPALPNLILPAIPAIPTLVPIDPGPLGNISINFTFPWNAVSDPLTNENEFIGFYDKNGTKCGAIRGQSIPEWFTNYFDVPWILTTAESFLARLDEDAGDIGPFSYVKLLAKSISTTIQFGYDFSQMGVEYSSGNGDYAEWLERADPNEKITYGDIVAVKGGKISKDLTGAEQIMAVSHQPIVLGNIPEKGKAALGNNIAFMGQIPVKVVGSVKAGDYIVAKSGITGYGIAVDPSNMKVEDYKLAVGRSWTTNENKGPKLVNTVVGVHNNGFLQIIKELQEKADTNDARLKAIEMKLNISSSTEKEQAKKPFK
jgi:hypothetical protein